MRCERCNTELNEENTRYVHSTVLCEDCFDEGYTYCNRCDAVISRSQAYYDNCGDAYCEECYDENYDDDAPDNPDVSDSDRELVIKLSRSWLQGKVETRRPIFINDKDILLKTIKDKVGLVDNPIYVFGLTDRDEYQLSVSSDLFDKTQNYVLLNDIKAIVVSGPGCNRIGISLSLRKNNQQQIIEMIKQITTVQDLVPA